MKTFKDLEFETQSHAMLGIQAKMYFDNGYGVSVIKGELTYGGKDGLYELAVVKKSGGLCFDSGITDDVLGSLKPKEVTKYMKKIQELKRWVKK